MKRIKILTVMLAVMLAGVCIFGGCSREWEVYTGKVEGGPLYSLEEIYEARAIGWRDFLNIAYHNGDIERNKWLLQNFEPEPIGELNEETAQKMRESMAEEDRNNGTHPEATAENFFIEVYLGCYYGYYAARFSDNLSDYPAVEVDPETYVDEVGGIKFYCYHSTIYLWKEI